MIGWASFFKKNGKVERVVGFISSILLKVKTALGRFTEKSNLQEEDKMAYELNWNPKGKPSEKDMKAYLQYIAPDYVDTAFMVIFDSDDCGRHAVIMAEWDEHGNSPWKEDQLIDGKGWRVIRMSVPDGYLRVFYNEDGSERKIKDADEYF
tara:strand:- start:30 stop:482 length:453 start_codon:yes stop_codon:yes gene_type:complete